LKPDIANPDAPAPATHPPQPAAVPDSFEDILDRPASQRLREYKYRFAQSLVFGLPVVALAAFGPAIGGPEAGRWIGLLQALLAGWVMYVGASGMLVEALMRRRVTLDGLAAAAAIGLYLLAVGTVAWRMMASGGAALASSRVLFSCAVLLACAWAGIRWLTRFPPR
jgi:cation transport ATPase